MVVRSAMTNRESMGSSNTAVAVDVESRTYFLYTLGLAIINSVEQRFQRRPMHTVVPAPHRRSQSKAAREHNNEN